MSPFLRVLENEVQLGALVFMAVVYGFRIAWIMRFRMPVERTFPAGDRAAAARLSLMNIARPWAMESARRHPGFYIQFAVFHLGVAAAIAATFIIPSHPAFFLNRTAAVAFQIVIGAAFAFGLARLFRRVTKPAIRLVSSPDDYFSISLMVLYFPAALLSIGRRAGQPEWPLIVFFGLTAFFLVYVPFSKIGHYLYYPFSRLILGRILGHRGALGAAAGMKGDSR
jgi:hypothetical protein